jgi:tRNA G18 (ribose-2'-O)-methylase SpoU
VNLNKFVEEESNAKYIYGRNPVIGALESPRKKPLKLYLQKDIQGGSN